MNIPPSKKAKLFVVTKLITLANRVPLTEDELHGGDFCICRLYHGRFPFQTTGISFLPQDKPGGIGGEPGIPGFPRADALSAFVVCTHIKCRRNARRRCFYCKRKGLIFEGAGQRQFESGIVDVCFPGNGGNTVHAVILSGNRFRFPNRFQRFARQLRQGISCRCTKKHADCKHTGTNELIHNKSPVDSAKNSRKKR